MAKRRKLDVPSVEDLGKIEAEFRRETSKSATSPPIAQIAGDAAQAQEAVDGLSRQGMVLAEAYREAEEQGRLIKKLPLSEIDTTSLQRDRTVLDQEALGELEHSIRAHGVRLPIEVYVLPKPDGQKRYGLLSGYRRFLAVRGLWAETNDSTYATIPSVVRDPDHIGGAFVAMVEENEIRQDLSHYERGRIAVIGAQQGAFASVEAAVAAMFAAASKAKRSKIRSFAAIFEELGDVLNFPESLREKDGLRLVKALRGGSGPFLRDALAAAAPDTAKAEWSLIDDLLQSLDDGGQAVTASKPQPKIRDETQSKIAVSLEADGSDHLLRLRGPGITDADLERAVAAVRQALAKVANT